MAKKVDISIIIINYKTKKLTSACLKSIDKFIENVNYEVILIDNNSEDDSISYIKNLKFKNFKLKIIANFENLGFSKANNQGIKVAKGRYFLLLNSDTEFKSRFISQMLDKLDNEKEVGIATCALRNTDNSLQVSGGYFPDLARVFTWMTIQDLPLVDNIIKPFHPKKAFSREIDLDWVTGAFFLIKKEVIKDIGLLDEDYFMYTEEVDFCFRARKKGWLIRYIPEWSIIHYGGASSVREFAILQETKGIKTLYKKHYPEWQSGVLRIFLKLGYLWRAALISPKIYFKAFKLA